MGARLDRNSVIPLGTDQSFHDDVRWIATRGTETKGCWEKFQHSESNPNHRILLDSRFRYLISLLSTRCLGQKESGESGIRVLSREKLNINFKVGETYLNLSLGRLAGEDPVKSFQISWPLAYPKVVGPDPGPSMCNSTVGRSLLARNVPFTV